MSVNRRYKLVIALAIVIVISSAAVVLAAERQSNDTAAAGTDPTGFTPISPYTPVSVVPDGYTPIYTFNDLMAINTNLGGSYILMNDITFTDANNTAFVPIGTVTSSYAPFNGIFDGNGHEISGMNVNISSSSSDAYAGLFGYVSYAQIMNLGVIDSTVSATPTSSNAYAGGIIGCVDSATIISNCYNTGDVSTPVTASFSSEYAGGIVGYVRDSAIISNCYNTGDVSSPIYAGGIVGYTGSAIISNCYNTGDVSTPVTSSCYYASAGGIAGSGGIITNCYNTGDVSSPIYAGGIIGYVDQMSAVTISNCYNNGNVSVTSSYYYASAGGIAGSGGIITNCYNTGDVSSSVYAGGIAGEAGLAIINCYNNGNVSALSYAGGIVGEAGLAIKNCYNTGTITSNVGAGGIAGIGDGMITNCYNTGDVSATSDEEYVCGGIVGVGFGDSTITITNCYFLTGTVSCNSIFENMICGTDSSFILNDIAMGNQASGAKTMEQMTPTLADAQNGNSIYYVGSGGWDFSDNGVWTIVEGENNGYPILQFHSDQSVSGGFVPISPYTPVSVVPDGYTPIYTFDDLMAINNNSTTLSGKYILMNDITFTDANNAALVPIGSSSSNPFKGIFDGNGYEISGMNVNISSSSSNVYAGLFGYVSGAQIMNLGVVDSTVSATSSYYAYAGGIVGCAASAITISNCYNTGDVSAYATSSYSDTYAGGIVGYVNGSATISNCYNTGDVSASSYYAYAGGIAGYGSGTIMNCYNTGDVSATSSLYSAYAGGIVGEASSAIISNCYNTGDVSSTYYAGGIVGYVNGSATISNCYNTGSVSATSSYYASAGGIAGYVQGSAIISNCYNTGNVSASYTGTSSSYAYAGGISGSGSTVLNCYNTGIVTATSSSSNYSAYAGGMVGYVQGSAIISNCYNTGYVSSTYYAGGIVGYGSGTIMNCYNTGDVSATSSLYSACAGGIVGEASSAIISNCYNTGDVSSTYYAGGIIGDGSGTIMNCYNTGSVSATSSYYASAGGMVGYVHDSAIITNCYNTGDVSASNSSSYACVGGIVGYVQGSAIISNCYNTGDVSATSSLYSAYAGGMVGYVQGSAIISNCYNTGDVSSSREAGGGMVGCAGYLATIITNCYNTGDISGVDVGGIVGLGSAIISNCYNTGDVSSSGYAGGIVGSGGGIISNCYFLGGAVSHNSVFEDRIYGNLTDQSVIRDNGTGDQSSGAKTMEQMTPTLADAQNGNSIYYVGSGGWDFSDNGVWTIVEGENNGYPILSSLGFVNTDTSSSHKVTLVQRTGYTLTPVNGSSSPVESGGSFSFTMTIDSEYAVNCVANVVANGEILSPVDDIYTIDNITSNQTVTVVLEPIIGSSSVKDGGSVEIDATVDPSAGATFVKVYITFDDGSVINSTFTIGPDGEFSAGYSGSMTPVSYLITAYDGNPGTSGVNMVGWTETNNI